VALALFLELSKLLVIAGKEFPGDNNLDGSNNGADKRGAVKGKMAWKLKHLWMVYLNLTSASLLINNLSFGMDWYLKESCRSQKKRILKGHLLFLFSSCIFSGG
jgi:hypothetical protein